eukprot:Opistho-2@63220
METYNVNREVKDSFYRYKMPKLLAKVEGKGNGIKTVLVNMVDVAKSLQRPPTYPTKYFGCELGAQTQFDDKNGRYIVNGSHEAVKLQQLLDGFIKKFVLCAQCKNPETNLRIDKHDNIWANCIACGHRGMLDMKHKLTTFILKNPPSPGIDHGTGKVKEAAAASEEPVAADSKKSKKSKKDKDAPVENGAAVETPVKTKSSKKDSKEADDDDDDDDDWSLDTSAEAVKARRIALEAELGEAGVRLANAQIAAQDAAKQETDKFIEKLKAVGQKRKAKEVQAEVAKLKIAEKVIPPLITEFYGKLHTPTAAEVEEAKDAAKAKGAKNVPTAASILYEQFQTITRESGRIINPLTTFSVVTARLTIGQFEKLFFAHPEIVARMPRVWHSLYDADVIDGDSMLQWADSPASGEFVEKAFTEKLKENSSSFIEWLRASDDSDSSSDDVPVTKRTLITASKAAPVAASHVDDINIDDI